MYWNKYLMSFFLFLPFIILCVFMGALEKTSGNKENAKCSAAPFTEKMSLPKPKYCLLHCTAEEVT